MSFDNLFGLVRARVFKNVFLKYIMNFNKIVWSYWEGPRNEILDKCLKSWYEHLPDYNIRILSKNDLVHYNLKFPTTFDKLNIAMKSDLIRLNVLYLYGGVWLDATILLKDNLDWLTKFIKTHSTTDYFQPKLSGKNYFENWMIVSPQKYNNNIRKQLNLMVEIAEHFPEHDETYIYKNCHCQYPQSRKKYFLHYQVFCYLVKNDKKFKPPIQLPFNARLAFYPIPFTKCQKFINGGKNYMKIILFVRLILVFVVARLFSDNARAIINFIFRL